MNGRLQNLTSRPLYRSFSTSLPRRNMAAASGAWGAWQAKPGQFTQLVADSMKKLYVNREQAMI